MQTAQRCQQTDSESKKNERIKKEVERRSKTEMNRKKRRHFIIQKGGWGSSVGRGKYYDHVKMGSKKEKKIKE